MWQLLLRWQLLWLLLRLQQLQWRLQRPNFQLAVFAIRLLLLLLLQKMLLLRLLLLWLLLQLMLLLLQLLWRLLLIELWPQNRLLLLLQLLLLGLRVHVEVKPAGGGFPPQRLQEPDARKSRPNGYGYISNIYIYI